MIIDVTVDMTADMSADIQHRSSRSQSGHWLCAAVQFRRMESHQKTRRLKQEGQSMCCAPGRRWRHHSHDVLVTAVVLPPMPIVAAAFGAVQSRTYYLHLCSTNYQDANCELDMEGRPLADRTAFYNFTFCCCCLLPWVSAVSCSERLANDLLQV